MHRFDDTFESSEYFSAVLSSPLRASGKSIGSITLERIGKKPFTSIDTDMLKLLSENASKILGWMDIHHQLNRSASRDGLTGLLNHKTFLNRFAKFKRRRFCIAEARWATVGPVSPPRKTEQVACTSWASSRRVRC